MGEMAEYYSAYDPWDEDDRGDDTCWRCGGEGYGLIGADWDCDDPLNGPYDGEIEECNCCGGSGKAEDVRYW